MNYFTLELIDSCKKVSDELLAMLNALKEKEISKIPSHIYHLQTHVHMYVHTLANSEYNASYLYSSVRQSSHQTMAASYSMYLHICLLAGYY